MDVSIAEQIEQLRQLKGAALRIKYQELFGGPSHSSNKAFLFRRIAWRLQARAQGDLSERTRQRAFEIADDADLRLRAPEGFFAEPTSESAAAPVARFKSRLEGRLPVPGTVLTRQFGNRKIIVTVLDHDAEQGNEQITTDAVQRQHAGTGIGGLNSRPGLQNQPYVHTPGQYEKDVNSGIFGIFGIIGALERMATDSEASASAATLKFTLSGWKRKYGSTYVRL